MKGESVPFARFCSPVLSSLCFAVLSHSVMSSSLRSWTVACQVPLSMGILQARKILEWVDMPWSRGSSQLRDGTQVSHVAGDWGTGGCPPSESPGKPKNTGRGTYPFSRGSSWPRNWTGVSCITGRFFTSWATREAPFFLTGTPSFPLSSFRYRGFHSAFFSGWICWCWSCLSFPSFENVFISPHPWSLFLVALGLFPSAWDNVLLLFLSGFHGFWG